MRDLRGITLIISKALKFLLLSRISHDFEIPPNILFSMVGKDPTINNLLFILVF